MKLEKIERFLFFVLIFSFFFQTGKHFWLPFSRVSGIRVDYLSPTLYASDVFVILLFITALTNEIIGKRIGKTLFEISSNKALLSVIFILAIATFFAKSKEASFFGSVKFIEFLFVGWYVAARFQKKYIPLLVDVLALCALVVSGIGIAQFFLQSSLNGVFYFLGERSFTVSTIGIAKMNLSGITLLRPYATFPHPNVFAFFLFVAGVFLLIRLRHEKEKLEKVFLLITFIISSVALLLTFSRLLIFSFLIVFLYFGFTKRKKNKTIAVGTVFILILLILFGFLFAERFIDLKSLLQDVEWRQDLLSIAWKIFIKNPYIGVGINNFFIHEIEYQKTVSPTLLQPVHNIYLLILVQTGIVGFGLLLWFIWQTIEEVVIKLHRTKVAELKDFYRGVFVIIVAILLNGLFDHYFLTLQQAQLLTAVILGLAWTKLKPKSTQ